MSESQINKIIQWLDSSADSQKPSSLPSDVDPATLLIVEALLKNLKAKNSVSDMTCVSRLMQTIKTIQREENSAKTNQQDQPTQSDADPDDSAIHFELDWLEDKIRWEEIRNEITENQSHQENLVDITENLKLQRIQQQNKNTKKNSASKKSNKNASHHRVLVIPRAGLIAAIITLSTLLVLVTLNSKQPTPFTRPPAKQAPIITQYPIASIIRTHNLVWDKNSIVPADDTTLKENTRYKISHGYLEFQIDKHETRALIQGPCEFQIIGSKGIVLNSGSLTARVDSQLAKGFYIQTPQGKVVDYGTEFSVSVDQKEGTKAMVFEGKVSIENNRMLLSKQQGPMLTKGYHASIDDSGAIQKPEDSNPIYHSASFVRFNQLDRIIKAANGSTYDQWLLNCQQIAKRKDLIFYFNGNLQQNKYDENIYNQATGINTELHDIHGKINRAKWAKGRWPKHDSALQFKEAEEYVEINIPGQYENLTMNAWVYLEPSTERHYRAICNSHRHGMPGQIHFQLEPGLGFDTNIDPNDSIITKPITSVAKFKTWHMLTASVNNETQKIDFYIDGKFFQSTPIVQKQIMQFGPTRIGNWFPSAYTIKKNRTLNGKINSLMIFNQALTSDQIQELYHKTNK